MFVWNFRSGRFYNSIFHMNVFLKKNDEWLEVIEFNVMLMWLWCGKQVSLWVTIFAFGMWFCNGCELEFPLPNYVLRI